MPAKETTAVWEASVKVRKVTRPVERLATEVAKQEEEEVYQGKPMNARFGFKKLKKRSGDGRKSNGKLTKPTLELTKPMFKKFADPLGHGVLIS